MGYNRSLFWLDGIKLIAIIAVVIDHVGLIMYTNNTISIISRFSVTLFIITSGIGTFYSYKLKGIPNFLKNLSNQALLVIKYAVAVIIISIVMNRDFNPLLIGYEILSFKSQGQYYYIFFFLQIKLISPYLLKIFEFCERSKNTKLYHALTLLGILVMSSISMNFMDYFNLLGGGRYLFGGTYLFVYYFAIWLASTGVFEMKECKLKYLLLYSSFFCFWWINLILKRVTIFDSYLSQFFGEGVNPPGLDLLIYTLIVLFCGYSFFSLMSISNKIGIKYLRKVITFLGRNTLYIFLYHMFVMNTIFMLYPNVLNNKAILRIFVFPTMIILSPIVTAVFSKLTSYLVRR